MIVECFVRCGEGVARLDGGQLNTNRDADGERVECTVVEGE
jgi:hypothetical protein